MEVLFIDDDPEDILLFEEAIAAIDHTITISKAYSARDALKLLMVKDYRPDLVILDFNLPMMSGLELVSVLRSQPQWESLPVVVVSTHCSPAKIEEFNLLHCPCYQKPATFSALLSLLQSILSTHSLKA